MSRDISGPLSATLTKTVSFFGGRCGNCQFSLVGGLHRLHGVAQQVGQDPLNLDLVDQNKIGAWIKGDVSRTPHP
jgi:hypothetical protein